MALVLGTCLGAYEVVSLLGAGAMGEVYRATDTNLKRQVALKVLPVEVGNDPDRLARFQREAEILAALNHPHIAAIYGLEEAANLHFLVLELVEGETLAERLARGPMRVRDAIPIAIQICEALEAAHEKGIVHRDLKPANIKLTPQGVVKVLDFGLATVFDAGLTTSGSSTLPTMMASHTAMVVGTPAYMSPEQATARHVDRTSDVWAFGCSLFEMLTGTAPFARTEIDDLISAILNAEPDWQRLPPDSPEGIRRLLRRCLQKDRKARLHDIAGAHRDAGRRHRGEPCGSTSRLGQMARAAGVVVRRHGPSRCGNLAGDSGIAPELCRPADAR